MWRCHAPCCLVRTLYLPTYSYATYIKLTSRASLVWHQIRVTQLQIAVEHGGRTQYNYAIWLGEVKATSLKT
ncbi:hypothetical protein F5X96DRAFT_457931 [Biscogniauxia mediterranea]|nr:hypothetical protein F5X96DRAFT_457931 [Biscogniauxia mediterranea]